MRWGILERNADFDLLRRLAVVLAFVFVFTAAVSHLSAVYSRKFYDRTAPAKWIWANHNLSANEPLAFFAAREIELPANRVYTRLKIAADPEYTLYLNGREVAGRRVGEDRSLDYYDISDRVQTGRNRIVVALRAPKGMGGLLVSIDIAPETENWIVSDERWRIYRRWDPLLLEFDIAGRSERPMIIGEPPIGSWNYLQIARRDLRDPASTLVPPKSAFAVEALFPAIRTQEGIAVATAERRRAVAYDFGGVEGRVRAVLEAETPVSRLVYVRLANHRNELGLIEWNLRPFVFAPDEREITTPESYGFRYAMAFARDVRMEVVK